MMMECMMKPCWKHDPDLFAKFTKAWMAQCPPFFRHTFRPMDWSVDAVKNFMKIDH